MHPAHEGDRPLAPPEADHAATSDARSGVLVIDDHEVFAEALAMAIDAQPDLSCAGVATTAEEALALADQKRPATAVVDLALAGGDGISLTRGLLRSHPDLRVMILTGRAPSAALVKESLEAGASAFLPKVVSLGAVVATIGRLSDECFTLDHETVRSLCNPERDRQRTAETRPGALTRRERDILELLVAGVDPQTAASRLGITVNTARGYVKNLYSKLGVHNQLELLAVARRRGLLDADTEESEGGEDASVDEGGFR
jgi:DNA-binding NarL/FixJ family response regulator